jgi:DNA adenine methylase
MKRDITPFVKWAGGKSQLVDRLSARLPESYSKYYEPFIGGRAFLFALQAKPAVINDINKQLIHTYKTIRDNSDALISCISQLDSNVCDKDFYYATRTQFNKKIANAEYDIELAALFIYINKHCFNGLYRVNSKGLFNVPWNNKQSGASISKSNIATMSAYLQDIEILQGDFESATATAENGDLVFFDSPYAPLNPTSFESYTKEGFSEEEHRRLSRLFRDLDHRGCYCILTNHNTEFIRELYNGYKIEEVDVRRAINSNAAKRTGKEVIIRNY